MERKKKKLEDVWWPIAERKTLLNYSNLSCLATMSKNNMISQGLVWGGEAIATGSGRWWHHVGLDNDIIAQWRWCDLNKMHLRPSVCVCVHACLFNTTIKLQANSFFSHIIPCRPCFFSSSMCVYGGCSSEIERENERHKEGEEIKAAPAAASPPPNLPQSLRFEDDSTDWLNDSPALWFTDSIFGIKECS